MVQDDLSDDDIGINRSDPCHPGNPKPASERLCDYFLSRFDSPRHLEPMRCGPILDTWLDLLSDHLTLFLMWARWGSRSQHFCGYERIWGDADPARDDVPAALDDAQPALLGMLMCESGAGSANEWLIEAPADSFLSSSADALLPVGGEWVERLGQDQRDLWWPVIERCAFATECREEGWRDGVQVEGGYPWDLWATLRFLSLSRHHLKEFEPATAGPTQSEVQVTTATDSEVDWPVVDDRARSLTFRGKQVRFSRDQSFCFLKVLVAKRGQFASHEELLHEVWGDRQVSPGAVHAAKSRLCREMLPEMPELAKAIMSFGSERYWINPEKLAALLGRRG